jgi:hypothetical protein
MEDVDIFHGHLVNFTVFLYFMDIWYSSWKFALFSRFGILYGEKSGNPGLHLALR